MNVVERKIDFIYVCFFFPEDRTSWDNLLFVTNNAMLALKFYSLAE